MINISYLFLYSYLHVNISVFLLFTNIILIKTVLICEIYIFKVLDAIFDHVTFKLGNSAHNKNCLQYWLPTVLTNVTIGTNGIANGTIGITLNDIGILLVPLVQL